MRTLHYKSHVKVRGAFASEIKVGTPCQRLVIASLTPIVGSIDVRSLRMRLTNEMRARR